MGVWAVAYEMFWEARGLYRRYYGRVTDAELMESTVITEASPQFDELRYTILDALEVQELIVSNPSFIAELAAIDSAAALTNPHIKVAVVTQSPEIGRLVELYKADPLCPFPTQVFGTLAEARKWAAP
jgi:hypothetical protein